MTKEAKDFWLSAVRYSKTFETIIFGEFVELDPATSANWPPDIREDLSTRSDMRVWLQIHFVFPNGSDHWRMRLFGLTQARLDLQAAISFPGCKKEKRFKRKFAALVSKIRASGLEKLAPVQLEIMEHEFLSMPHALHA
jgi:hypothetical protein